MWIIKLTRRGKQQNKQLWQDNKARSQLPIVRERAGLKWSSFKSLFLTLSISVTCCHTHTSTGREAVRLWSEAPAAGDSSPPRVTGHENMFVCHSEKSVSKRVRSFKILQYISKHNPQGSCRALITNCFSWCSAQIHVTEDHLECRRNTVIPTVWEAETRKLLKQKIQTSLGNMPGSPSQVKNKIKILRSTEAYSRRIRRL